MENMESNHLEEKEIILAKINLAEMSKSYEEMVSAVKELVDCDPELSSQEFYLLAVAYKNVVNIRRDSWIVVNNTQRKELITGHIENITKAQNMRNQIENEMRSYCSEILDMLDNKILPNATIDESKVVCFKLKGDFNRFLAEFEELEPRKEAIRKALAAYKTAFELATAGLEVTHPMRLALVLNYSVFEYEFREEREMAYRRVEIAHDEAFTEIHKLSEEKGAETILVLKLLKENLLQWEREMKKINEARMIPNKNVDPSNPFLKLF